MAMTFDELPIGACYALAPTARQAAAKKTGARSALTWPDGRTLQPPSNVPVRLMAWRPVLAGRAEKEKVMRRRSLAQMRRPERYLVVGPRNKPRRVYTDFEDAVAFAHRCSKRYTGGLCRVAQGWPGSERVIVECLQDKCQRIRNGVLSRR